MDIYMFIAIALDRLSNFDPITYPNLGYYRDRTTVFRHLETILHLFESKDRPVVTIDEKAYFLFSKRYIKQWSKEEADCGGTEERWQSHKIFLMDLGLIETYTVTGPSKDPVQNRIWSRAKMKKQKSETLWTIPLYDDNLLERAERIAGLYHEYGISISHLRKNVIIRFRGQKRANWLYADWRVIGAAEAKILAYCHKVIKEAVNTKGYTTFKEMETRVHALLTGRQYFQQRLAELLNPEEQRRLNQSILYLILQEKNLLCHEAGCVYRQIRKEDRDKLGIPNALKSWIIVPGTAAAPGHGQEPWYSQV